MLAERWEWEAFGEDVGVIFRCRYELDLERAGRFELTHLEEATIDVTRPMARLTVARQLDGLPSGVLNSKISRSGVYALSASPQRS